MKQLIKNIIELFQNDFVKTENKWHVTITKTKNGLKFKTYYHFNRKEKENHQIDYKEMLVNQLKKIDYTKPILINHNWIVNDNAWFFANSKKDLMKMLDKSLNKSILKTKKINISLI